MKPDIEKYLPYLDHPDLTDEKKIELIYRVWQFSEAFVDHAWGTGPLQNLDLKIDPERDKPKFARPKDGKPVNSALTGLYVFEEDSEPLSEDEVDQLFASCGMVT